jgi:hypothetical protein
MGITRVSNQLWMEPLRYKSCLLMMGWCMAHAWPTPCVAHAWLTPILATGYQCLVLWDGLVRGSCVAHTPPSCWVPVSVPQDKSPRSQELNRQVSSRRFIQRCPVPNDRDTAYRLYSVDGESIQTLAPHTTFWNVNTVLIFHATPAVRAPIWVSM